MLKRQLDSATKHANRTEKALTPTAHGKIEVSKPGSEASIRDGSMVARGNLAPPLAKSGRDK